MSKRRADWTNYEPPPKAPRLSTSPQQHQQQAPETAPRKHAWQSYLPRIKHSNHPESKVGTNFHAVSYPLTLLPYDSWWTLHSSADPTKPYRFQCPRCFAVRTPTPHARKLFLVAERLSWSDGTVSTAERNNNEEKNWEVNYELGILDPSIEDPDQRPGGRKSRLNEWHPYETEFEMRSALKLVEKADHLTEASWKVWVAMMDAMLRDQEQEPKPESAVRYESLYAPAAPKQTPGPPQHQPASATAYSSSTRLAPMGSVPAMASGTTTRTRAQALAAAQPAPDPVVSMLARRATTNPELKSIMKLVAARRATPQQVEIFQGHVDELARWNEMRTASKPPSISLPLQALSSISPQHGSKHSTQSHDFALHPKANDENRLPFPAPPSSSPILTFDHKNATQPESHTASQPPTIPSVESIPNISFRTIQDFYSLLDQIERTSYVGAMFLEAYAEYLRHDLCGNCWFQFNVLADTPPPTQQAPVQYAPVQQLPVQYAPPQHAPVQHTPGSYTPAQYPP
ncbi:uncharacterized protein BDZ99DRAFT_497090 [Mytilinidion resinicola]|uniref:Uncharacterized protein n=1 Tax=Mytilinidion resinicola TaxID=574789 RepID=A0A6A6YW56_9PEZI|nr:uncharacterized protein BDZ99DRAFT_497090 [Mytilinidion resinicola]KAF2812749.1 hypothetical protein BDZ99DRAFT_497090 [Mytilinidion resinicola]